MSKLTVEKKAELFDYLAEHAKEVKMSVDGSSDWLYNDSRKRSPETFAAMLESFIEMMNETDEEDDEQ